MAFGQYPYPGGGYPGGGYPGGGYPPGNYPPGTYPPGSNPNAGGIPIPSKSGTAKPTSNAPLPNFRGKMKQMDDKTITLETDDHRDLQFKRSAKTKFFKSGDEVKSPKFTVGDQLSVEASEDPGGYFSAVNVYWEKGSKSSGDTETASANKHESGSAPDVWKDDAKPGTAPPAPSTPSTSAPTTSATEMAPPPAPPDPDDPGRPKLVRGKASDPSREHASDAPYTPPPPAGQSTGSLAPPVADGGTAPAANTLGNPSVLRGDEEPVVRRPIGDPLIAKATEAALDFTEGLPNYVCQEMIARYQSSTRPANWQAQDVVSTNLVYLDGKEDYRDITINGRPFKKGMEQMEGSWSTGEFGTMLIDLLSPATNAQFRYRRDERTSGINAKVYDYTVKRENSHWQIGMGSQTYRPAYKGSVWIDPTNGRVMRIEMQAFGFPEDFPTDDVESAMDYQYTRLGDAKQYLLPVHSESLSCQRGSDFCSHNVIDFRNYHKYSGESSITFGDSVKK